MTNDKTTQEVREPVLPDPTVKRWPPKGEPLDLPEPDPQHEVGY